MGCIGSNRFITTKTPCGSPITQFIIKPTELATFHVHLKTYTFVKIEYYLTFLFNRIQLSLHVKVKKHHMHVPPTCFTECQDNMVLYKSSSTHSHNFLRPGQRSKQPKLKPSEVTHLQLREGSWDFEPRQPDTSPFYTLSSFFCCSVNQI